MGRFLGKWNSPETPRSLWEVGLCTPPRGPTGLGTAISIGKTTCVFPFKHKWISPALRSARPCPWWRCWGTRPGQLCALCSGPRDWHCPLLSACCLGQSIRITWSLVNPQGLGPAPGDAVQVWGRLRVGFSDMSPGDPGATSLRAHVKNHQAFLHSWRVCWDRQPAPGGAPAGAPAGAESPNAGGGCHSEAVAPGGSPSPVRLPCGLLSWSAPQQTRDAAFLASFSLMLQKAFWTMPLSYRRPFRGCPLALRASPNSPKMTSTSLLGSEILLVPVNSSGSLASWAPLLLFALPGMLQPGQLSLIRPQRSHHLLWGVPSDLWVQQLPLQRLHATSYFPQFSFSQLYQGPDYCPFTSLSVACQLPEGRKPVPASFM